MASEKDLILRSGRSPRLEGRREETPAGARVCMGVVGAPHGVRGAVRVKSFAAAAEDIAAYGALSDESGERRFTLKVIGTAKGDGMVIAEIADIGDRDRAETLRGLRLYAPRAVLPPPSADEFYHADLIGLAVELGDGRPVGRVAAVYDFGAGDMLEIVRETGRPVLVPFTRAAVPVVDPAAGRIVIDPPAGVLDDASRAEAAA